MSLISKKHLSMAIQSLKNIFNRKIKDSTADWNQNDSSADNYVKNRTHWEEKTTTTLVDNLTLEELIQSFENGSPPACNFVVGQTYNVIWNGTLYEGLVCWTDGEYNIISPEDHSTPFYIDDDGGDSLYINGELDEDENMLPFTVSITTTETVIHKIDSKYLPETGVKSWNDLEDRPFGLEETVLFEGNVTLDQYRNYDFEPDLDLVVDQEYTCIIDGTRYSGICYWDDVDGDCFPLKDGDDNYVGWVYRYGMYLYEDYFETFSSHDVKICTQEIQKIDDIYLPDDIARTADIESMQTAVESMQTTVNENTKNSMTFIDRRSNLSSIDFNWNKIVYGNGIYVAVNKENTSRCAYSKDCVNWITTTLPSSSVITDIVYGDGKFVAIGGYSTNSAFQHGYYSEDGINWKQMTLSHQAKWHRVIYAFNKFIAININSYAACSSDGINWVQMTSLSSNTAIAFGDGKLVADVYSSRDIVYSTDGVSWTTVSSAKPSSGVSNITYGNGKFVMSSSGTSQLMYSEDGITWELTKDLRITSWSNILYVNDVFIGLAGGLTIVYSIDGVEWTEATLPSGYSTRIVCSAIYATDRYIIVGYNGLYYSKDCNNWSLNFTGIVQNSSDVYDEIKDLIMPKFSTTKVGQTIVAKSVDNNGEPTEWEAVDRNQFNYFILTDSVTNYEYIVCMTNGNLTSVCKTVSVAVTTIPTQTEYINGEPFNPTGMVVTATCQDGTTKIVKDYAYGLVTKDNASAFEIRYTEADTTYTTTIGLTIIDVGSSLSDFTYTIEEDGTYTLTGWNGTLNGVKSTECILPDSNKINL